MVNDIQTAVNNLEAGLANYAETTGSSNAYLIDLSPNISSPIVAGNYFWLKANHTNTGAATINADSVGVKDIKRQDGSALVGGEIVSGQLHLLVYDGTNFILVFRERLMIDNETPTGTIDGTNDDFTLSKTPSPAGSLQLYLDGVLQVATVDYTLTGNAIAYTTPPTGGSVHRAWYRA
jgi:hypothetical protein